MQFVAESLRISAFSTTPADYRKAPVEDWWQLVAKAEPDQAIRVAASSQAMAEGPFGNGRLSVSVTPGRVDWQAGPALPPSGGDQWPSYGIWPDCIEEFVTSISEWLAISERISRFAFGAVVALPVGSTRSGYESLETALAEFNLKLPADATDFLLQINLPVASKNGPPGMTINRVTRWAVARVSPLFLQVALKAEQQPNIIVANSQDEKYALRMELDFNTAAEWAHVIPPEEIGPLIDELTQLTVSYVEERIRHE